MSGRAEQDVYGKDWDAFSARIRFERAGGRCECRGQCGNPNCVGVQAQSGRIVTIDDLCVRRHGEFHFDDPFGDGVRVILTVAHLCHDKPCRKEDHVLAMCQRCHLSYDMPHHVENAGRTRDAKRGQERLFP